MTRSRIANLLTRLGLRLLDAGARMDRGYRPPRSEREWAERMAATQDDTLLESPEVDTLATYGWTDAGDLARGARPWPGTWESDRIWRRCGGFHAWERVAVYPPEGLSSEGEFVIRCSLCHVPRCGHSDDANPCTRRRHHDGLHAPLHSGRVLVSRSFPVATADPIYDLPGLSSLDTDAEVASRYEPVRVEAPGEPTR